MPRSGDQVQQLYRRRDELRASLAEVGDFRPGSLVERYRRCGKTGCHCTGKGAAGHGPSWSLTREVGGKTRTRVIPPDAVEQTRRQLAEQRRFRGITRELIETSEQLCDALLAAPEAASREATEKGGSKQPLRRSSPPRSKRS